MAKRTSVLQTNHFFDAEDKTATEKQLFFLRSLMHADSVIIIHESRAKDIVKELKNHICGEETRTEQELNTLHEYLEDLCTVLAYFNRCPEHLKPYVLDPESLKQCL